MTNYTFVTGSLLTNSAVSYSTIPDNSVGLPREIKLMNGAVSPVGVDLWFVPPGSAATYSNQEFTSVSPSGIVLAAGETKWIPTKAVLSAGTTIQAKASIGSVVSMSVRGGMIP